MKFLAGNGLFVPSVAMQVPALEFGIRRAEKVAGSPVEDLPLTLAYDRRDTETVSPA
jgi:hypothetical protein